MSTASRKVLTAVVCCIVVCMWVVHQQVESVSLVGGLHTTATSSPTMMIASSLSSNENNNRHNTPCPETTVVERTSQQQDNDHRTNTEKKKRPFKFHIYDIPRKYIEGAIETLQHAWPTSYCNRHKIKTNYTMLDWRHAHSLFTVDTFIARFLKHHPHHTSDPEEADVFIIPMMTHLYNCAGVMHYMSEILNIVTSKPYYKRMDGHDHFVFWWRWGMNYGATRRFWKHLMSTVPAVNFISFEFLELTAKGELYQDFSLALKPKFTNAMHSIVMPYPDFSPHLQGTPITKSNVHAPRKQFFYFAGTSNIGGIRRWIKRECLSHTTLCKYDDFGTNVIDSKRLGVPTAYPLEFLASTFCGHAAGDGLSSRRPTTAILAGCIPVLICDLCLYAFENVLDYSTFAVFVKEDDVIEGKLFSI
eukprot:PhF_6_TR26270/c0_g1_i3/m.37605